MRIHTNRLTLALLALLALTMGALGLSTPARAAAVAETEAAAEPVLASVVPFDASVQKSDTNILYGVKKNGDLIWHRHVMSGPRNNRTHAWNPPKLVGIGWREGFRNAYPAGKLGIFHLAEGGELRWHWHSGALDGSNSWQAPALSAGLDWTKYAQIIPMDRGVIYAITHDGDLLWFRYLKYQDDKGGVDGINGWSGPVKVAWGWNTWKNVFAGGNGILYAVTADGKLMWTHHRDYLNPPKSSTATSTEAEKKRWDRSWAPAKEVGEGWGEFTKIFSPGNGHIYAVRPNGDLEYFWHLGFPYGTKVWEEKSQGKIATGWNAYDYTFTRITAGG